MVHVNVIMTLIFTTYSEEEYAAAQELNPGQVGIERQNFKNIKPIIKPQRPQTQRPKASPSHQRRPPAQTANPRP